MGTVARPLLTPELLEQMTEAIVQTVAPEQIVLFGSQARGSAGPHSDVDLLVVTAAGFGPHRSRIQEITRISTLTRSPGSTSLAPLLDPPSMPKPAISIF